MSAPAGAHTVRRHNLGLVLRQVGAAEPVSRARVAELSGLTRGTVSSLVDELLAGGLLEELAADRGGPGRPANPLRLSRSGPAALGLELNVDHASVCVLDLSGAVRALRTAPSDGPSWSSPGVALDAVAELATAALAEVVELHPAAGVVAVAGVVDRAGLLQRAPNLPGWTGLDVGAELTARLRLPVRAGNEADLGALGELWFGGLGAHEDFLHVSGEIGVGAGIVLGGSLFGGGGGRAGELGHVVVDPGGAACSCGGRGCLEQVVGQRALLAAAGVDTVAALERGARAGDQRVLGALAGAGAALGLAVAGAVNVLDVPVVVLGGVHARLGRWLVPPIVAELAARSLGGPRPQVLVSTLGPAAAVRGAAGSVVRAVLDDRGRTWRTGLVQGERVSSSTLVAVGPGLAVGVVLLALVAAAVSRWGGLGHDRQVLVAVVRAVVQLAVVAVVIGGLLRSFGLSLLFVVVMAAVAIRTAGRRLTRGAGWWWAGVPLLAGVLPVVVALLLTGLVPRTGLAVIPVSGILLGGAMTATSLAGRSALDELVSRRGEREAALALGFVERDAALLVCRDAASRALVPALDQTRTVGLVTLPGAFVGLLLAGASPVSAGAVQVFVLAALLAVEAVSVVVVTELVARGHWR